MLVVTRRIGEKVMVGDNIELTILEVSGNTTKIGIKAPRDIPVHREEIYHKIQQEEVTEDKN